MKIVLPEKLAMDARIIVRNAIFQYMASREIQIIHP